MHLIAAYLLTVVFLRLRYAIDQADYQVACEEEANLHYDTPMPQGMARARVWGRGFRNGLLCRRVPDWFARAVRKPAPASPRY